jgi:hypothetical protein
MMGVTGYRIFKERLGIRHAVDAIRQKDCSFESESRHVKPCNGLVQGAYRGTSSVFMEAKADILDEIRKQAS